MEPPRITCYGRRLMVTNAYRGTVPVAVALLLGALLCGCSRTADDAPARRAGSAPAASGASRTSAAPAGPTDADLVMAVAANKTRLPIEVRFRLADKPVVGQPLHIELVVTPLQQPIHNLRLRLQPGSALVLQGDRDLTSDAVTPGVAIRHDIEVVPQSAGVLELETSAAFDTDSDSMSQTYSIPLVVQASANPG